MARFLKKGFTSFINFLKNKIRNIKNRRAVDNKENVKLTKIDKKKNKELLKLERKNKRLLKLENKKSKKIKKKLKKI